jgi:hypothetical protein
MGMVTNCLTLTASMGLILGVECRSAEAGNIVLSPSTDVCAQETLLFPTVTRSTIRCASQIFIGYKDTSYIDTCSIEASQSLVYDKSTRQWNFSGGVNKSSGCSNNITHNSPHQVDDFSWPNDVFIPARWVAMHGGAGGVRVNGGLTGSWNLHEKSNILEYCGEVSGAPLQINPSFCESIHIGL